MWIGFYNPTGSRLARSDWHVNKLGIFLRRLYSSLVSTKLQNFTQRSTSPYSTHPIHWRNVRQGNSWGPDQNRTAGWLSHSSKVSIRFDHFVHERAFSSSADYFQSITYRCHPCIAIWQQSSLFIHRLHFRRKLQCAKTQWTQSPSNGADNSFKFL